MGKKKKEKKKEKKYASNVEERMKKVKSLESSEDTEYWKENEKLIEKFMKFGRMRHKSKGSVKDEKRLKNK